MSESWKIKHIDAQNETFIRHSKQLLERYVTNGKEE